MSKQKSLTECPCGNNRLLIHYGWFDDQEFGKALTSEHRFKMLEKALVKCSKCYKLHYHNLLTGETTKYVTGKTTIKE